MNILWGYRFINFVANKELSGKTMQPHEYNVMLAAHSMNFFNVEFQKLRAHAAQNKQNIFQIIELGHPLKPLVDIHTLAAIPASGKVAVPPLFVDPKSARVFVNGIPRRLDFVSFEYLNNRLTNPLETSLVDMPAAVVMGDFIQVYPKDVTNLVLTYLRYPKPPYMAFSVDPATDLPVFMEKELIRGQAEIAITGTIVPGNTEKLIVTISEGDTREVGRYVVATGDTLADVHHGFCANINRRNKVHGFNAEVKSNGKLYVYAPITAGESANAYSTAKDGGMTYTISDFDDEATAAAGSCPIEFDPEYHMEIYKMIMGTLGFNLSDERLMQYQKAFEVAGV